MKKNYEGRYCVVRADRSGVFAGNVYERNDTEIVIKNCRRLWYWDGANSISDLAKKGTKRPNNCKFTVAIDEMEVLGVIEIIPCSEEAEKSIKEVKVWNY